MLTAPEWIPGNEASPAAGPARLSKPPETVAAPVLTDVAVVFMPVSRTISAASATGSRVSMTSCSEVTIPADPDFTFDALVVILGRFVLSAAAAGARAAVPALRASAPVLASSTPFFTAATPAATLTAPG
jgi:hypothetical protein